MDLEFKQIIQMFYQVKVFRLGTRLELARTLYNMVGFLEDKRLLFGVLQEIKPQHIKIYFLLMVWPINNDIATLVALRPPHHA